MERKKLGFELLISDIFSNLGRLMIVNLIFAIPFLGSIAIAWAVYKFLLPLFIVVMPLSLVLAAPFYPGVVLLSREYSQGNKPASILKTYFKAVKENGLRFLLCGVLLYVAVLGTYFGVKVYLQMAAMSGIFYVLMFFVLLVALFFLFFFFAVPLMTVSFDLKVKAIYKNSALMTFGEIKNNFFATIGTLAFLMVVLFPMIVLPYLGAILPLWSVKLILVSYMAVAFGLLIPAPCALIISHYLYPNMKTVITGEGVPAFTPAAAKSSADDGADATKEITPTPQEIEELSKGDGDEYIFYMGKMIRRKVLLEMLKEKGD